MYALSTLNRVTCFTPGIVPNWEGDVIPNFGAIVLTFEGFTKGLRETTINTQE